MFNWWFEVITKPEIYRSAADNAILWLVPIFCFIVTCIVVIVVSWIVDTVKKKMALNKAAKQEEERKKRGIHE